MTRAGAGLLALILVSSLWVWPALSKNVAALQTLRHLSRSQECAANLGLVWTGGGVPGGQSRYLQALSASAGAPGAGISLVQEWQGDPRLLRWFKAQSLIREGKYAESLTYLKEAQAGAMLAAGGHFLLARGKEACAIFTWLLANEITPGITRPDVDDLTPWALGLLVEKKEDVVIEAYSNALAYQPDNHEWKAMVDRARQLKSEP